MESILDTIKKLLGIDPTYEAFDTDIVVDINSVFMALTQLGLGPSSGFSITDKTAKWSDFLETNTDLEAVKTYIFIKVKLMFDPTASSTILESYTNIANELEFRLALRVEEKVAEAATVTPV